MPHLEELIRLLILAIPVATVAWTITHEEIFRELQEWLRVRRDSARTLAVRKFFYLFTCEFCFSFYVSGAAVLITRFRLLYGGILGAVVAWFSLVWIANIYMSIYARLKLDIKKDRVELTEMEKAREESRFALERDRVGR